MSCPNQADPSKEEIPKRSVRTWEGKGSGVGRLNEKKDDDLSAGQRRKEIDDRLARTV